MASGGSGSDPLRPPTGGQRKGKGIVVDPPRRRRPNIIRIEDAGYARLSSTQRPRTSRPTQAPASSAPTQPTSHSAPTQPAGPSASTPIYMMPTPGFQQTLGASSSHFVPETVPDTHLSDHEFSTGQAPDQTGVDHDEEVEQQEDEQEVRDDIQMLRDGRVAIRPAGRG